MPCDYNQQMVIISQAGASGQLLAKYKDLCVILSGILGQKQTQDWEQKKQGKREDMFKVA